jgi:hypothetical protein
MEHDVFLSHNSKDKPTVEKLAHLLEARELKVWLDKWNLVPGDAWQEDIEQALDDSQTIAVCVGAHEISPWENEEMRSAIEERVKDKSRRVIPVLLPGAPDSKDLKLPRFLKRLTWVDLRNGIEDEEGLYRLECGIRGIPPKPQNDAPALNPDEIPAPADLPRGSWIPFYNNRFTGREEYLKTLAKALTPSPSPKGRGGQQWITITGMGGLGKTQLAAEFARRYVRYFRGAHWLNLADASQFDSELAQNGARMNLPNFPQDNLPAQVEATLEAWRADAPRLVVLDNLEDGAAAAKILPRLMNANVRVLTTARSSDWQAFQGAQTISLGEFSAAESRAFFQKTAPKHGDADADLDALTERLGGLPLALELAARYLHVRPRLSVRAYLAEMKTALEHPSMQAAWDVKRQGGTPTEHDINLRATFALSWEALQATGALDTSFANDLQGSTNANDAQRPTNDLQPSTYELAQKIFMSAGYLAPNNPVPLEIFENALKIPPTACDEALSLLYALGLLSESPTPQLPNYLIPIHQPSTPCSPTTPATSPKTMKACSPR